MSFWILLPLGFRLFWGYFFSSQAHSVIRKTSFLSLSALALSGFSFVLVLGIMKDLGARVQSRLRDSQPHVVFKKKDDQPFEIDKFGFLNFVEDFICIRFQDVVLLSPSGSYQAVTMWHISKDKWPIFKRRLISEGAVTEIFQFGHQEIFFSSALAQQLQILLGESVKVLSVGDLIKPVLTMEKPKDFLVKGFIHFKNGDWNNTVAVIFNAHLDCHKQNDEVWLWFKEVSQIEPLLERHRDQLNQYFFVSTWLDRNRGVLLGLRFEKFFVRLFLTIMATLAFMTIHSVLRLALAKKEADIALLQLMGISPQGIKQLMMIVFGLLVFISLGFGVILGILVTLLLNWHPITLLPDIYYDSRISAQLDGESLVILMLVLIIFVHVSLKLLNRQWRSYQVALILKQRYFD